MSEEGSSSCRECGLGEAPNGERSACGNVTFQFCQYNMELKNVKVRLDGLRTHEIGEDVVWYKLKHGKLEPKLNFMYQNELN